MVDVFISYKREDREPAERLARMLADRGYQVWWDAELMSGDTFITVIYEVLKVAKAAVVLWSENALTSRYVLGEAMFALNREIYIGAVLTPRLDLPPPFNIVQSQDVSHWHTNPAILEGLIPAIARKAGPARRSGVSDDAAAALSAAAVQEALMWRGIANSQQRDDFLAYLETYGDDGLFARLARGRIAALDPMSASAKVLPAVAIRPVMVELPPGRFRMGASRLMPDTFEDELPRHGVTFERGFAIGRAAVSFAEYDGFCRATGRALVRDEDWGRGKRPAIHVSWNDAVAYCRWLSAELKAEYRLPSEAEWEYAARADSSTTYPWGSAWDGTHANGASTVAGTSEPGAYPANGFGLFDMIGNVWEWCADAWHDTYAGAPVDGAAWVADGDPRLRVMRGGSWDDHPQALRVTMRGWYQHDGSSLRIGFRLARSL